MIFLLITEWSHQYVVGTSAPASGSLDGPPLPPVDSLPFWLFGMAFTVQPVLAVTSIKQPTCLKQPNKMFPNVKFVLIFTSVQQPPALGSHFLCLPCVAA